jgi:hypothetical protein
VTATGTACRAQTHRAGASLKLRIRGAVAIALVLRDPRAISKVPARASGNGHRTHADLTDALHRSLERTRDRR